jgi:hypothetical protein
MKVGHAGVAGSHGWSDSSMDLILSFLAGYSATEKAWNVHSDDDNMINACRAVCVMRISRKYSEKTTPTAALYTVNAK